MFDFQTKSITQKLMIIVMAPAFAALVVVCAFLFLFDLAIIRQSMMNEATLSARFAADQLGDHLRWDNRGQAEQALHMFRQNERILAAGLYTKEGEVFARYFRDQTPTPLPAELPTGDRMTFQGGALHVYHPIKAVNERIGMLYLQLDVRFLQYRMAAYSIAALLILVMGMLVAYLLSTRLQAAIADPLRHLALLAKVVTEEKDYSVRAIKHADDEIGVLVDEFNDMLTQIERRDRSLQSAHDNLEERVNQRTRELQLEIGEHKRTAGELQQEVRVRVAAEKDLQQAIEAAEAASRSKGDFLANMSHEIRTPMNGIIGMTELLMSTSLTPIQYKYADTVRRSGRALLKIIGDILDYSKVEAGQLVIEPIPFDMQVACEDVVELLSTRAEEKNVALVLRYAPRCPRRLVGDAGRIRQVLTNLVANAIKFTHEGYVLVDIDCTGMTDASAAIRFSVEDTGIGAPEDKLSAIFGKYSQGDPSVAQRYGGTGLGLAISKQLVELMGGSIGVQSRVGAGSRFYFTLFLPLDDREAPTPPSRATLAGVRILVIDHSGVNQRVLREQVNSWDMRADVTGSSAEALRLLREAREANDPYRIALIDDQMPGLRGESLGRSIKTEPGLEETLLVLLTALGQRGDAQRMTDLGFAAYLTRPIRQSELMDALATLWSAHLNGEKVGLITRHTIAEQREFEEDAAERAMAKGVHARLLVVEDNAVNQQVAMEILQNMGCTVSIASDGVEALEKLAEQEFDLVFMDCQMPRMNGYETTREIRRREADARRTPVVAMTAHAMKGDRERCIEAGMDDYLSKPIETESVLRALRRWLPEAFDGEPAKAVPETEWPEDVAEAPVLDMEQALWVTGGKFAMFQRIATVFMQHMPNRLRELELAVRNNDISEISRLTHSIQGAAASIGAQRLRNIAQEAENLARDNRLEDPRSHFASIEIAFVELRETLAAMDWEQASNSESNHAGAAKEGE